MEMREFQLRFPDISDVEVNDVTPKRFTKPVSELLSYFDKWEYANGSAY